MHLWSLIKIKLADLNIPAPTYWLVKEVFYKPLNPQSFKLFENPFFLPITELLFGDVISSPVSTDIPQDLKQNVHYFIALWLIKHTSSNALLNAQLWAACGQK